MGQIFKKIPFPAINTFLLILILIRPLNCDCNAGVQLNTAEGSHVAKVKENDTDYFEVPVVSPIIVSAQNPFFEFKNPESNSVYMGYTVHYKGQVIYQSDGVVEPSKFVNWNVYDSFGKKGTYDISVDVITYDINTLSQCSSANIMSKVTIR